MTLRNRKFLRLFQPVIVRNPIAILPEPKPIIQVIQKPKETVEAKPTSQNAPYRDSNIVSHDRNSAQQEPLDTTPQAATNRADSYPSEDEAPNDPP